MVGDRPQGGKTSLMTACEQGKILEAKIILQKKPQSIGSRDKQGKTALHYAAEAGSLACAQLLVAGADSRLLDAADAEGFTALHLAIISGHRSVARLLLKAGADPDGLDKERHSAIHWAAVCGDAESLDLLLAAGANPSSPDILGAYPVHYAAQMCGAHALNGKDPRTGLDALRRLVQGGADIQCRDRDGREPLLWAASAGSSEAVLTLFTAGANISASDKDGLTALHCAASRGHTGCVETLITLCGARVDAGDHIGCSPLFYAAAQGQADCAQVLLKHCAEPNRQDNKGRTPAHCAAVKGRLEILRILDSNGGDMWVRNSRGNLPLHEAVVSGRKDMVQWLLQQCPRAVNATNISGRTPLHIAAQHNNVEMCEVLIEYGAFINPLMVNAKGFLMTPLDVSVHQGNQRCAKYLQLHGAVPGTKVLENNEINRSLLFSLGNYAFQQKDRYDEEPSSAAMFDPQEPQPANGRDAHTRTIRGGKQPPLPQTHIPHESELTNVVNEDASEDASVHIHLSRDDLWTLWESLMQELTSEMSGSEMSQGSELRQKTTRRSSEVKQLKPILTNVYLRRGSSQAQVIAGESILDIHGDAVATRSVSEDTKLKYPRRATEDLKLSLPKVAEVEKLKTGESRRPASSRISDSGVTHPDSYPNKEPGDASDSVGSDTEHQSAMREAKAVRLRKKKSDARSWGKDIEESETSSANRPDQKEDNPYLKRYLQRQARAAEMRKYLTEQNLDDDDVFQDDRLPAVPNSERVPSHRRKKSVSYEDLPTAKHRLQQAMREDAEHSDDKSDVDLKGKTSSMPSKSVRRHSRSHAEQRDLLEEASHKHTHRGHKHKPHDEEEPCSKGHYHTGVCRLKKRHSKDNGRKKRGTSPRQDLGRKSSTDLLEVPYQQSATTPTASDERSGDISYEEKMKLHHYHHHHHHRHHHQPQKLQYLDRRMNIPYEDHHLEHHKHSRRFHRRKPHSKYRSHSVGDVDLPKLYSDSENEGGEDKIYSGGDIRRAKSEMSGLPWFTSRDVLTQSSLPEVNEKDSLDDSEDDYDSPVSKRGERVRTVKADIEKPQKKADRMSLPRRDNQEVEDAKQAVQVVQKDADKTDKPRKHARDKSPRAKSKTRRSKPKTVREKKSYKIPSQIKKSSPRRESKVPGKPPLRAAQSFSGTLSEETKDIPLRQKSQSARMEKDLPEIRVFSAEGKETDFVGRGELSEVQERNENSNASSDIDEQKNLRSIKDTDDGKAVAHRRASKPELYSEQLDQTESNDEESLGFKKEVRQNARARPDGHDALKSSEKQDSLSEDDSSEDDEPEEILYRDETLESQHVDSGINIIESITRYGEAIANQTEDGMMNAKESKLENIKEGYTDEENEQKESVLTNRIEADDPESDLHLQTDSYADNTSSRKKLEKESSIAEFEKLEKMVEMSERDDAEDVKETAKKHVEDIIQRAQSEVLKVVSSSLEKNENSEINSGETESDSRQIATTKPKKTLILLDGSGMDNGVKICNEDEVSDPGSTSEAETKFNTDSEEIEPEPDLTDLLTAAEDIKQGLKNPSVENKELTSINELDLNVNNDLDVRRNNDNEVKNLTKSNSTAIIDKIQQGTETDGTDLGIFSSAEVQTDFDDVRTIEGLVRGEREEHNLFGFNRSISVQTSDLNSTVLPLLENNENLENKHACTNNDQKSISIQTDLPEIAVHKTKDKVDEIKEAIRMANDNDISGKTKLSPRSEDKNSVEEVLRSPERHNPGAVFYTTGSDIDSPRRGSEKQNIGAMFYSVEAPVNHPVTNKANMKRQTIVADKDTARAKVANSRPKVLRSSVRDRSLESERAVAIANSAFHRLNSRGELTVFNSSLLTDPSNIPFMSTSSFDAKTSCLRRGEQHSNLEKSGFLWVHFGSGSSPVSVKKRPSLSSQAIHRESRFIRDKSKLAKNIAGRQETDNRRQKKVSISKDSSNLMKQSERKSRKTSPRKDVDDVTNPALHVSSKVLTNKKIRKVSLSNDSIFRDESPNKPKSKIPHFSDHETRRRSVLEKNPQREASKKLDTRKPHDSPSKLQQSPRIPRLCRESSFADKSDLHPKVQTKQDGIAKESHPERSEPDKHSHHRKQKNSGKSRMKEIERNEMVQEECKQQNGDLGSRSGNSREIGHSVDQSATETNRDNSRGNDGRERSSNVSFKDTLDAKDTINLRTNEIDQVTTKNDVGSTPKRSRSSRRSSSSNQRRSASRNTSGYRDERRNQQNDRDNSSRNSRRNDDPRPPRPRLSETAKSSSLDEGDVRLVIERRADPDFSIKISMKDKNKTGNHQKSTIQYESDPSYTKDLGFISTTELVHRHRRSITIDLGHTKAMINAGLRKPSSSQKCEIIKNTDSTIAFSEEIEKNYSENQNGNKDSQTDSQKILPSKLPIAGSHRQRSNSLVIINQPHTPRKKSASVDGKLGEKPRSSRLDRDNKKEPMSPRVSSTRLLGCDRDKYSRRASIATEGFPIYKAHSDSSLHRLGKSANRETRSSQPRFSPGKPLLIPPKKPINVAKPNSASKLNLEVENGNQQNAENSKLPSIFLFKPEETTDSTNSEPRESADTNQAEGGDSPANPPTLTMEPVPVPRTPHRGSTSIPKTPKRDQDPRATSHKPISRSERRESVTRTPRHELNENSSRHEQTPRTPRHDLTPRTPRHDLTPRTPRHDQTPRTPRHDQTPRTPRHDQIPRTPRHDLIPGTPRHDLIPRTPRHDQTPRTQRHDLIPGTPRHDLIPRTPRHDLTPRTPRHDLIPRTPRHDLIPRTPRRDLIPRTPRRDLIPRTPRHDLTPRTPRHDLTPRTPRNELTPRHQPTPITPRSLYSPFSQQPILQQPVRCKCKIEPHQFWDGRRTKSAVECIASLQFLSEDELQQFDERLLAMVRRSSYSSGLRTSTPGGFRALRTQTLKRLRSGRRSTESLTFHVDHDLERNSFKLPTDKLRKNKKWQVVFTIGKSKKKRKKGAKVRKKQYRANPADLP